MAEDQDSSARQKQVLMQHSLHLEKSLVRRVCLFSGMGMRAEIWVRKACWRSGARKEALLRLMDAENPGWPVETAMFRSTTPPKAFREGSR
jgi:hypothetical protein